jgi:predicted Fe-Mo cluster-binding NifX family protein
MSTMRLAVPTMGQAGPNSARSGHFGHCDCFSIVTIEDGKIAGVEGVANPHREQGSCLSPVQALQAAGVDAVVAAGMGARPMAAFKQLGIPVYFDDQAPTVAEVAAKVAAGAVREIGPNDTCRH